MNEKQNKVNRRNFLKTIGATGLVPAFAGMTTVLNSTEAIATPGKPNTVEEKQKTRLPQMPKRRLGKTGIEVSTLSLGAIFLVVESQITLREAFRLGVDYWDTAYEYTGGNSELGIGKFLSKNPDARKKLVIASKASHAKTVADIEKCLQTSLERMKTEYIDLYYGIHGLDNPAQLTDELKQWAESAKKRKLIRAFGISTHKNMPQCLFAAAKLPWIDMVETVYNFRLIQDAKMQAAVDACHKAGIGLVAMKVMGHRQTADWEAGKCTIETEGDKKLVAHFLQRGFTEEQAKIKVVLEDKRFSSACVGMANVALLTSNATAVLDKTKLSQADMDVLKEYAQITRSSYCAGCGYICDSSLPKTPYVSDVMRYLMYYNSYGEHDRAKELFAQIPSKVRNKLLSTDYSSAETRCPQHIPIGKLISEAVSKLA